MLIFLRCWILPSITITLVDSTMWHLRCSTDGPHQSGFVGRRHNGDDKGVLARWAGVGGEACDWKTAMERARGRNDIDSDNLLKSTGFCSSQTNQVISELLYQQLIQVTSPCALFVRRFASLLTF